MSVSADHETLLLTKPHRSLFLHVLAFNTRTCVLSVESQHPAFGPHQWVTTKAAGDRLPATTWARHGRRRQHCIPGRSSLVASVIIPQPGPHKFVHPLDMCYLIDVGDTSKARRRLTSMTLRGAQDRCRGGIWGEDQELFLCACR